MTERGFKLSTIEDHDYILGGATQLKGAVLQPTGQWDADLPTPENQNLGFEPYACVTFAILNAVEILIRHEYGTVENFSDRWLAWVTGTGVKQGNDPTTVCMALGKKGDVHETDWPYDATHFYDTPPQTFYTLAKEFFLHYEYDNQWVPSTQLNMMEALTRSPLTAAGFAWQANDDGIYYWPDGAAPNHYFVVYGYEPNHCWHVFDTYENNYKKVVWNYPFVQVKEHTIHSNVVNQTAWDRFVAILFSIIGL